MNGYFARTLWLLGAYVLGWAIAYAASAIGDLLTSPGRLGFTHGHDPGLLPVWLLSEAVWFAVATLGAYLLTKVGGRRAVVLGLVTAVGGLSALFVPLLIYGFPAHVFAKFWFETLVLAGWLPLAVFTLSKWR